LIIGVLQYFEVNLDITSKIQFQFTILDEQNDDLTWTFEPQTLIEVLDSNSHIFLLDFSSFT